jgi:DNA-binding winged helix-turn-helix (wHTH) protein/tetratricopeptide (TPR) repeat protein
MDFAMDDANRQPALSSSVYRFGLFTLDASAGSLTRNGLRVKLQEQPFQLLVLLLEKHGEVVTREEIRRRLWESDTFVDFDKSLGVDVLKVREALGDSAANPRFLETLPRRGYRFIAPVSVEGPSAGLNASPVSQPTEATIGQPVSLGTGTAPPGSRSPAHEPSGRTSRQRLWFAAAALGATFAVAFVAYRLHGVSPPAVAPPPPSSQKLRRSVAVLGFRNVAGGPEQNWLSTALTEMLNTELAASGDLRLVSGEDVANVKHDLDLRDEDTLAKSTLTRLRSSLGADMVVVGSYTLLNDGEKNRIRLDMRVQDTGLGETIFEDSITSDERDLFDLASQAGSRLRERLNPSLALAPGTDPPPSAGSSNELALQFYSQGRARLYEFDFVGARDLLKRAVAADPNFALAHSALSSALASLGFEAQARDEAKRALQHTQGMPQETALTIQGQYQESNNDWHGAAQTYDTLFQRFPDNLTYGLELAGAQLHVNPADSEQTLAALRMLPSPVGDDPRIDLMEARALIGKDLPRARTIAQQAIAKASAQHATLMMARGYGILCEQDSSVGVSLDQSLSECNLARNSYDSAGDRNNSARTLNDLAVLYYQHGDLDKAEAMWNEAIEVFRSLGETEGLAASSNNVGEVLLTRGKLDEAKKPLQQALAGYTLAGDRPGVALVMADLGEIALRKADLSAARSSYEQTVAMGTHIGDTNATAYGMAGLGDVEMEQDQLAAARKQYESALKLRESLGEKQTILQTKVALARITTEEGHAADAEPELRRCQDQLHQAQWFDDELGAGLLLTDVLLDQAKNADARNEIVSIRPFEEKTQNRELQLRFSLESARVLLAGHDLRSARTQLDTVAREADASGFVGLAWEAQTLLAEVQEEAGDMPGATHKLNLVAAQARSAGFLLRTRKAGATAKFLTNPGEPSHASQ